MRSLSIALVGDRNDEVIAHRAIPRALMLAGTQSGVSVSWQWRDTAGIDPAAADGFSAFDGIWCVPASPYESEAGALAAIRFAREHDIPFLGTCGGCQHAILEYARNVLGLHGAAHAETRPEAELALIAPLSCALVETRGTIRLAAGTRIRAIYGTEEIMEGYHCSFGLNPALEHLLDGSALKITGRDAAGEARALELEGNRFHLMTQFQPERLALTGVVPPLVAAFLAAAGV